MPKPIDLVFSERLKLTLKINDYIAEHGITMDTSCLEMIDVLSSLGLLDVEACKKYLGDGLEVVEPLCKNCKLFYTTPKCKYATGPDQYADECHAYKQIDADQHTYDCYA